MEGMQRDESRRGVGGMDHCHNSGHKANQCDTNGDTSTRDVFTECCSVLYLLISRQCPQIHPQNACTCKVQEIISYHVPVCSPVQASLRMRRYLLVHPACSAHLFEHAPCMRAIVFLSHSSCLLAHLLAQHHSLPHARSHSPTHSLTHSRTHALSHSHHHSLTHSLPPSLPHSLIHALTHRYALPCDPLSAARPSCWRRTRRTTMMTWRCRG